MTEHEVADASRHDYDDGREKDFVEKLEHFEPGYGEERSPEAVNDIRDEDNPNVYHKVRNLGVTFQVSEMLTDVADVLPSVRLIDRHVFPLGRISDSPVPVWQCVAAYLQ